ncbi:MAG: gliding motility lipoprotein GldD [Dysgonamonadaceae bacterium]|jgi:gliding motility-associated lipoprotein GldD|nr:gliding motility lipoprotein GldD [Dysgonamonadaceae bacterium]
MKYLSFFILCLFICSCSGDYSPKPSGYFRIGLEEPVYRQYVDSSSHFSFNIQQKAMIEIVPDTTDGERFNIVYPSLNARIHCSFLPVKSRNDLIKASEDSRRFAYVHVIKADGIFEKAYSDPENKIYALVYDIDGNVASPLQFVITDSVHYFFRGSLYFNVIPNQDSIAPVREYIRNDIKEIVTGFRWYCE